MGIVRSFVFGVLTWMMLMELRMSPELALGGAVAAAFLVESAQNRSRQHRLMEQSRGLKRHIHRSSLHIEELQFHLQKTNQSLPLVMFLLFHKMTWQLLVQTLPFALLM